MDTVNILIVISAVVLIFLLWLVVGVRHLKRLRHGIKEQWEILNEGLRKRHSLIPNLIETIKIYDQGQEKLVARVISERMKAAKEYSAGAKKIEFEHDLSKSIDEMIDLGKKETELSKDTNFLELRKEINDLEKNIEAKSKKYNEMVRYYNRHRKSIFLRPLSAVFGFKVMNIFEAEV